MKTEFARPFNNDVKKIVNVALVDDVKERYTDEKGQVRVRSVVKFND